MKRSIPIINIAVSLLLTLTLIFTLCACSTGESDTKPSEGTPSIEETPETESTPAIGETPEAEDTPTIGETPEAEGAPAIRETPEAEDTPAIGETPEAEDTPIIGETPEAEDTPVIEETPEAEEETTPEEKTGSAVTLTSDDGLFSISTEDGTVTKDGAIFRITSAGTFMLAGTLAEGQIVVEAGEEDEVELDLDGVSVTCSSDSPILALSAGRVKVKALAGTSSEIRDSRPLRADENDTAGSGAIYALCDLSLVGTGSLTVTSTYHNGVHTKDDLKIKNLTLYVTSPGSALKGNDSITVESGALTLISSQGDGIETENSDISAKENQRGIVTITGGTIQIYSACDGIDSAYDVLLSGDATSVTILTQSYSPYTDSDMKKTSSFSWYGVTSSTESAKGIKADNQITISGGSVEIRSMDDGIHANSDVALENGETPAGSITISGGSVTVTAADDGIHADGDLLINGGYIDVVESYEGLEGHTVTVNGGEIHIYATDDGVNATSAGNRYSDGLITVNGGRMYVEVAGRDVDGIDSNGSYAQTGGFVVVSNPNADENGMMSALDVDSSVTVTGGVIIALGTVPGGGFGGGGFGGGPGGRGGGGFFGMGSMNAGSSLPDGYVTFSGTLAAGEHTFTFGDVSESFTLKSSVTGGWIWASGISDGAYTLK